MSQRPSLVKALQAALTDEYLLYTGEPTVEWLLGEIDPEFLNRKDPESGLSFSAATQDELRQAAEQTVIKWEQDNRMVPLTPFEQLSSKDRKPWILMAQRFASHTVRNPGKVFAAALYHEYDGIVRELEYRREDDEPPYPCLEWYPIGTLPAHRQQAMRSNWDEFPVPVQTLVRAFSGSEARPLQGRIWPCGFVTEVDGSLRIVYYQARRREEYLSKRKRLVPSFELAPAYLVEVYEDLGELCHEPFHGYTLDGHAVMTRDQLRAYLEKIVQSRGERVPLYEEILKGAASR